MARRILWFGQAAQKVLLATHRGRSALSRIAPLFMIAVLVGCIGAPFVGVEEDAPPTTEFIEVGQEEYPEPEEVRAEPRVWRTGPDAGRSR